MNCTNVLPAFLAGAWASIVVAAFCLLVGYLLRSRGKVQSTSVLAAIEPEMMNDSKEA